MQVFPNKDVREFMEKDFSSFMFRKNSEKYFRMWIGDTNGSKSILQKIIKKWLGDYYCDVPSKLYSTSNKDSSGPNPELAQTEDAAIAFSAEPDSTVPWSGSLIKRYTGGDSYYARKNHDDGGSIEATFKSCVSLNIVPDFGDMDEATKERCLFINLGEFLTIKHHTHCLNKDYKQVLQFIYTQKKIGCTQLKKLHD